MPYWVAMRTTRGSALAEVTEIATAKPAASIDQRHRWFLSHVILPKWFSFLAFCPSPMVVTLG